MTTRSLLLFYHILLFASQRARAEPPEAPRDRGEKPTPIPAGRGSSLSFGNDSGERKDKARRRGKKRDEEIMLSRIAGGDDRKVELTHEIQGQEGEGTLRGEEGVSRSPNEVHLLDNNKQHEDSGRRRLDISDCLRVKISGCEGLLPAFMTTYDLHQDSCSGKAMYYNQNNGFFLYFMDDYQVWLLGAQCGSTSVAAYFSGDHEPFLGTEGGFCADSGGNAIPSNLMVDCVEAGQLGRVTKRDAAS